MDDWSGWTQVAQIARVALLVGGAWLGLSLPVALCLGRALRRAEAPSPMDAPVPHTLTRVPAAPLHAARRFRRAHTRLVALQPLHPHP